MKANFLGIAVLAVAILNTDSFGEKNAITELPGDFTVSFGKKPWPEKVKKPADGLPIVASHAVRTTYDLRQPIKSQRLQVRRPAGQYCRLPCVPPEIAR
jgi:hypothetical protein